jgi:hypothetical protein
MQLILPIVAIGIAAVMSILNSQQIKEAEKEMSKPSHIVSTSPTETDAPIPTTKLDEEKTDPTSIPTPTIQSQNKSSNFNDFIYPGATNKWNGNYESGDDPDTITNWYKEKIISTGMNVKTFVTTKTNGNVLNKLAGANSSLSVLVEIEKKEGESITKIIISK